MPPIQARKILAFLTQKFAADGPNGAPDFDISAPVSLDRLASGTVSFCTGDAVSDAKLSVPGAMILCRPGAFQPGAATLIPVENPRLAFGKLVAEFFVPSAPHGVHPSAVIDPSAVLADGISIGPNCVIGPECSVGQGSSIGANVVLERNVHVGRNCIIRAGSCLGQAGFGIETDLDSTNFQIPHIGGVIVEDNVTIGCLTTIASGTLNPTRIRANVVIDDHVFLAHNVDIGARSLVIACAEVSGSVTIGEDCWIGPNTSIMNKATIGDRSLVGLGAVVTKSCPENVVLVGSPARVLKARHPE